MKKITIFILNAFAITHLITFNFASAPANNLEKKVAPKLRINWSANLQPKYISLKGMNKWHDVSKVSSIKLERYGYGELPSTVFVIYPNNAQILTIKQAQNKLELTPAPTGQTNQVWLWGQTPKAYCQGLSFYGATVYESLELTRFLKENKKINMSYSSTFLFQLSKGELIHFYGTIAKLNSLEGPFKEVNDNTKLFRCQLFYGVSCQKLIELHPKKDQKIYKIDTRFAKPENCPV